MEEAVPKGVQLEAGHAGQRLHVRQHVVPLQDLVKHDPVEEAAYAQAEYDGAPHDAPSATVLLRIVVGLFAHVRRLLFPLRILIGREKYGCVPTEEL